MVGSFCTARHTLMVYLWSECMVWKMVLSLYFACLTDSAMVYVWQQRGLDRVQGMILTMLLVTLCATPAAVTGNRNAAGLIESVLIVAGGWMVFCSYYMWPERNVLPVKIMLYTGWVAICLSAALFWAYRRSCATFSGVLTTWDFVVSIALVLGVLFLGSGWIVGSAVSLVAYGALLCLGFGFLVWRPRVRVY